MSDSAAILAFLVERSGDKPGKKVKVDPGTIATETGITREKVNKTLANLRARGRVELLRGPNGRDIIGYELKPAKPDLRSAANRAAAGRGPKRARGPVRLPRVGSPESDAKLTSLERSAPKLVERLTGGIRRPFTPNIDRYATDKATFQNMRDMLGDRLVDATFKEDPVAEEALLIREQYDVLDRERKEWRLRAEAAERQLRDQQRATSASVAQRAHEAGAVAVAGE